MTNQQILKQAIEKAVKNGWKLPKLEYADEWSVTGDGIQEDYNTYIDFERIIFSHDFAKAFAKYLLKENKKLPCELSFYEGSNEAIMQVKKALLQQMVLEKEPLQYLKKYL